MILTLTFCYGLLKFQDLVVRKNPSIVTNTVPIDDEESFNTGQNDFIMAFAAIRGNTGTSFLNDPSYIRWSSQFMSSQKELRGRELLHSCTDEEI